jgi:hypothetical protein
MKEMLAIHVVAAVCLLLALLLQPHQLSDWERMRRKFRGKRAFIIGNGPSLNKTPLHLLKDEITIVFNRFHLMFERIPFRPTFYMCIDSVVVVDIAEDIKSQMLPQVQHAFFPKSHKEVSYKQLLGNTPKQHWFTFDEVNGKSGVDSGEMFVATSGTVASAALEVLNELGLSPLYLVGVDMDYKGDSSATVHSEQAREQARALSQSGGQLKKQEGGADAVEGKSADRDDLEREDEVHLEGTADSDPDHFDPRYFGKGRKYKVPNVTTVMMPALLKAREIVTDRQREERRGSRRNKRPRSTAASIDAGVDADADAALDAVIFNAGVGGKLDAVAFPRVALTNILTPTSTVEQIRTFLDAIPDLCEAHQRQWRQVNGAVASDTAGGSTSGGTSIAGGCPMVFGSGRAGEGWGHFFPGAVGLYDSGYCGDVNPAGPKQQSPKAWVAEEMVVANLSASADGCSRNMAGVESSKGSSAPAGEGKVLYMPPSFHDLLKTHIAYGPVGGEHLLVRRTRPE